MLCYRYKTALTSSPQNYPFLNSITLPLDSRAFSTTVFTAQDQRSIINFCLIRSASILQYNNFFIRGQTHILNLFSLA